MWGAFDYCDIAGKWFGPEVKIVGMFIKGYCNNRWCVTVKEYFLEKYRCACVVV
jgi:hypothetical protein